MTARAIARRSLLARPLLVQPVSESAVVNIISARLEYLRNDHGISSSSVLFLAEDRWKASALPTEVRTDTVANFFLQQTFSESEYQQETILSFQETLSYFRGCIYDLQMDKFRPLGSPDRYVESIVGLFDALHKNCISPVRYVAHVNNHSKSWPLEYAERQVELSRAFSDFHDCCRRDNVMTKWGALHQMLMYELHSSDHFTNNTLSKYFQGETGVHVFIRGLQNLSLLELRLLRGIFFQGQDGAFQHGKVHTGKKQSDKPNVCVIGFNDFSSGNIYPSNIVETIFPHNEKPDFDICTYIADCDELPCSSHKVPQHIHFEFSDGEEELRSLCQRIDNQINFYNNNIAVVARRLKHARRVAKSLRAYGFEVVSHGNVEVPLSHDIYVRVSLALLAVVETINARESDLSEADGMLSDQNIFTIMSSYECIPLAKMMAVLSKSRENRSSTLSTLEQDSVFRTMIDDINLCVQTYFLHISRGDIPAAQIAVVKQFMVQRGWSKQFQKSSSEIDERHSQNMEDLATLVSQSNGNVEFLRSRCAMWPQRRNVRADPNKCVHVYSMVQLRREVMSGTKQFETVYIYGMSTGRLPSIMSGRLQTRAPPGLFPLGIEHGPPYAFDAFSSHAKAAKFARACHQKNEFKLLLSTSTDVAARVISSSSLRYGSEKNEIKPSPWLKDGVLGNVLFLNGRKKSPANQERSDQLNHFSVDCLPLHDSDAINSLILEKGKHIKYLSFSQINLYERCPKSYMMKYILNIPSGTPSAIMVYGSLMHEVIADFWTVRADHCNLVITDTNEEDSMSAMKSKMMESFSEKWRKAKNSALFFSPAHFEALHNAGRTGISHFVDRYFHVPSPIGIEQVFTVSLPGHDGIELKGVFDLIDHTGTIVEFKSNKVGLAGQKGVENIARSSLQPVLYAMACPEAPEVVVEGVENGHRMHVKIDDQNIEKAQNAIDVVVDGIQNANYRPTSSFFTCSFCDYRHVCSDSANPR